MKKKLLLLILAAALLAGCQKTPEDTPDTTAPEDTTSVTETTAPEETTVATEPVEQSFYVEASAMERGTGGAIRVYEMEQTVTGIATLGENLVVCTEGTRLYLLNGRTLDIITQRELETTISWEQSDLIIKDDRLAYYDATSSTYIILDDNLLTVSAIAMEEKTELTPIINSRCEVIFFVDTDGIRALDLGTGTTRLLRQEHEQIVSLNSVLFEDSVLRYTRRLDDGTLQECFIDTENGQLYSAVQFQDRLQTWGSQYVAILKQEHPLGENTYLLTGGLNGPSYVLNQSGNWDSATFPGQGLAVLELENSVGLALSVYDLNTGILTSQVTMPQLYSSIGYSCAQGSSIWMWDGEGSRFYCWDIEKTALTVETSTLTIYSTLEFEDAEGLERCSQRANNLSKTYGVKISLTQGENRSQGVDYTGYADYRPDYYMTALNKLEEILKKLPQEFLDTVAAKSKSGYLQIHLVDDFDPAAGVAEGTGLCDLSNQQVTLKISMCADLEPIFYHELFHAIETRIRNTCDDLDRWENLNPEGFVYGIADNGEYTQQGRNWFVDSHSLTSAREDRAQIFMYAMMDGQERLFQSEAIQAKLAELCRLIRKTYKLSEEAVLPWEQYLITE